VGLPRRLVIGPEYRFGLEDNVTDAVAVSDVAIEMRDRNGRRIFGGVTAARGDELFAIFLKLKDASTTATVSASWVETRADASQCTRRVEQTVIGIRRLYFPPRCQEGAYRPRSVIVTCGDANFRLRKIRWRGWTRNVATGRATAMANDCTPSCVAGTFRRYKVAVRAYRPRRCPESGRYQYTRLRIRFIGRKWNPGPRRFVQRFPCSADA